MKDHEHKQNFNVPWQPEPAQKQKKDRNEQNVWLEQARESNDNLQVKNFKAAKTQQSL